MSMITVEWWERVCMELSRNPTEATRTITEFRDSEQALEASKHFLQPSTGCSPIAQFQAALIIQHVCLKHWSNLSISNIQELRNCLWTVIQASLNSGTMPSFSLNKIMQVYALLWKRAWQEIDHQCKQELFQHIRALMQHQEYMKVGATLLRTVFEEFCSRSSAESGLPMQFHRIAHNAFEQSGLDDGLEIASHCLLASFSILNLISEDPKSVLLAATTVSEASKLVVEVINWDFGSAEKFSFGLSKESEKDKLKTIDLLDLPKKWASVILTEQFVSGVFDAYTRMRTVLDHFLLNQNTSRYFIKRTSLLTHDDSDHYYDNCTLIIVRLQLYDSNNILTTITVLL
jgi:hypothetical protein